jgi:hypothetical protein
VRRPIPAPLEAHPLSGCAKEPFQGGKPPRDGVLALAFHTLLSFQGTSPGCSSATHLRFPPPVAAGAAGRYHGPFKIVKDFPPARSAYSWWSTTRHVDTFTQKRRPAPRTFWASGRPPNSRRIDSYWRSATSCLPMPTPWASSGEVLGLEELPCLQLGDGSTAFDTVSTCRCCWTPATTTVPRGLGCHPGQRFPGDRYSPAGFRTGGSPR